MPIDEDHAFIAGLSPVIGENGIALGASYQLNEHQSIHLAGMYLPPTVLQDTGRGDLFSILGKGSELIASGAYLSVGFSHLF